MDEQLGIGWPLAGLVVLTTVAMYLTLVLCVRVLGQRSLATMSSFDLGCAIALGAVVGRTALLVDPTLAVGLVAMVTLFATQIALARVRRSRWVDRLLNRPPVLLMVGSRPLHGNLRSSHVAEDELRQRLRLAGVRNPAEVRCVVLERNGSVSVVRRGEPLDPWLFSDVPGMEALEAAGPGGRATGR
ncbi:DUF421 domain-containing protein [Geodermatophilus sp. SYSU D00758]